MTCFLTIHLSQKKKQWFKSWKILLLYCVTEINIIGNQTCSFCSVLDCWRISSWYAYSVNSIMINAVDARTLIPTNSGFILVESLLLVWVQDELVLVSAPKNLSKTLKYSIYAVHLFLISFENRLYSIHNSKRNMKP